MNWKKAASFLLAGTLLAGCSAPETGTETGDSSDEFSVVVQIDSDLSTMDHQLATDSSSFTMAKMCFSGLTFVGSDAQVTPEIAESWDISEDGKTYTFHIRDDAYWSDGTPVTAQDFVFAWQRLDDPDTASEYAFILDTAHIVNAAEVNGGEKDVSELGVEATDDKTLVVHLSLPCEFFLSLMAFPSFYPLNEDFYNAHQDTYAQSPEDLLYCGHYTMTDWQQGNEYTFTKNQDYFDVDEEAADTVTFKFIQDTQSALMAYEQGDIDVVNLQSDQVDQYKDTDGYYNNLQGSVWYLSLNYGVDSLANDNMRTALSYAVDRKTIAEDVLKNGSIEADGIIPYNFAFGPDGTDFRDTAGDLTEYDPDKAAEYYEKAKEELGGDVTLDLLYDDSESCKAVSENLQAQLQESCPGLTVTLTAKPKKTRIELMDGHEFDLCLTKWGPDYADPETFMDNFLSDNFNNSGSYSNPEYDSLVKAGTVGDDAADAEARWKDFIEAEKILVSEDHAIVPIYQDGGAKVINPAITNLSFPTVGASDYCHIHKAA